MKPTAKQLVESILWSLDTKVAPLTDDKWAASTLRSVRCLLLHLSVRVDLEGELLHADNLDLREVLTGVLETLAPERDRPDVAGCCASITRALTTEWRPDGAYPTIASMTEENDALRQAIDDLLALVGDADGLDAGVRDPARQAAEDWIRRRLLRDQPLFIPAFMANNF